MADTKPSAMTEDLTPDATDVIWVQTADGLTDKRIPVSSLAIQSELDAKVSNDTYSAAWNGVTTIAPSKHVVYDALVGIQADADQALTDIAAHLADTGDAHNASAISLLDTAGDFDATNVEDALAELQTFDETIPTTYAPLNSPTLVTPTIASFVNATHDHQAAAGGGTLDHGTALTGLTDDDHTQYARLAGRSGGQSLIGGTASGNDLTLTSTSHATLGLIQAASGIKSYGADQTFTAQPNRVLDVSNTFTLNYTNASFGGGALGTGKAVIHQGPTLLLQQNGGTFTNIAFKQQATVKNVAGSGTTTIGQVAAFHSKSTVTADTDAITTGSSADFYSNPTFSTTNGGTFALTTDYVHYETLLALPDAGASFTGDYASFAMLAPTGSGTMTKVAGLRLAMGTKGSTYNYGVHIGPNSVAWGGTGINRGIYVEAAPTGGSTNTGIHNVGTLRQIGKANFGTSTEPVYGIHIVGTAQDVGAIHLPEAASTPTNPASGSGIVVYHKTDAIVFAFNDGGTMRYKSLTMTGTGVTWVHSTTAP